MPFVYEKLDATLDGHAAKSLHARGIAASRQLSQDFNDHERWVDAHSGFVLYELSRQAGPGWRGGDFVLFVDDTPIQFNCTWPAYAFDKYHCRVTWRGESLSAQPEEQKLRTAIVSAMHSYCAHDAKETGGALDEFSLVF